MQTTSRRSSLAPTLLLFIALQIALNHGLAAPASAPAAATAVTVASAPRAEAPFAKEIAAFVASDRIHPPPTNAILFIGSSSIRLWTNLAADFPRHTVINRGFGGSQIIDSVNYFDQIVLPYRPRLIVLYAGGNDINAKKSPERVFHDFRAFAAKVKSQLPDTRLAYISIAPNPARWAQIEQVRDANRQIESFIRADAKMRFIDTHSQMLGADGSPKPDIYVADRLHMNERGYRIWTQVVAPYLDDWH